MNSCGSIRTIAPQVHFPSTSSGHVLWNESQVQVPCTQRSPAAHGKSQGTHVPSRHQDWSSQVHVPPQPSSPQAPPSQSGTQTQCPFSQVSFVLHAPQNSPQPLSPQTLSPQSGTQTQCPSWQASLLPQPPHEPPQPSPPQVLPPQCGVHSLSLRFRRRFLLRTFAVAGPAANAASAAAIVAVHTPRREAAVAASRANVSNDDSSITPPCRAASDAGVMKAAVLVRPASDAPP
jgi:hypothetical protein